MARLVTTLQSLPPRYGLRVLVVENDTQVRASLVRHLDAFGCSVHVTGSARGALDAVEHSSFDLALVDPRIGAESGLDLGARLVSEATGLTVVLLAACAPLGSSSDVLGQGAWDHIPEIFAPGQLRHLLDRVHEQRELRRRLADAESRIADAAPGVGLVVRSQAMRRMLGLLARAAPTDVTVLLLGEPGTEVIEVGRLLHARSTRAVAPFVVVDCAALPPEQLATDLFGCGENTDGRSRRGRPGRVELAEGGTLLLEEIVDAPPLVQARLLRLLGEQKLERVGEPRTRNADVRIVATATADLEAAVRAGTLRDDLLYHLNVVEIVVPPLRERQEDIRSIALAILETYARKWRRPLLRLAERAAQSLAAYNWPGNVRELRNVLERAALRCANATIDLTDLPPDLIESASSVPNLGGDFTLKEIEREHVLRVTQRTRGLQQAARILGIDASTFWRKRKSYEAECKRGCADPG